MHNKSVICAIIKDEQRYIREWVEHNLDAGFDQIYLYEDFGSTPHQEVLSDFIEKSTVVLTPLEGNSLGITKRTTGEGNSTQNQLFNYFIKACKDGDIKADWVGFFDPDEFITFEDSYSLQKLEEEFSYCGGVLLAWLMYGADGHINRPEGRIQDNYTVHMPKDFLFEGNPKWMFKSLVNVSKVSTDHNIHIFKGCKPTNHSDEYDLCYEKAYLKHFFTKSWEDFCERMEARGNMGNYNRTYDQFFKVNPDMLEIEKHLLEERRNSSLVGTMWISKKYGIIAGGNARILRG